MDKLEFESFVELKIRDIIALVMEREALDFEIALDYLYESSLYRLLLIESTKLWHLSNEKLFEMLVGEKENKHLIFPDYV
jgi:hypothetical protein